MPLGRPLFLQTRLIGMQVLALLQQHQHVVLDDAYDSGLVERTEEPDASKGEVHVWGSLVAFVERLDDELFKSLQVPPPPPLPWTSLDPSSNE